VPFAVTKLSDNALNGRVYIMLFSVSTIFLGFKTLIENCDEVHTF